MRVAPRSPELQHTLSEIPRAGLEATRLALQFPTIVREAPEGDGHRVLVLPSYGLGDAGMAQLRLFLRLIGYDTPLSGIGMNVDRGELRIRRVEDAARFRAEQVKRVVERIDALYSETQCEISLVGWSMGGLFAFDASQCVPDRVRRVVTLGSPFGDPRGTSMWGLLRWLSGSDVPVAQQDFSPWLDRARVVSEKVPISVLYSESDGIVAPEIAQVGYDRCLQYKRVESSHLGFAANPEVYRLIATLLSEPR